MTDPRDVVVQAARDVLRQGGPGHPLLANLERAVADLDGVGASTAQVNDCATIGHTFKYVAERWMCADCGAMKSEMTAASAPCVFPADAGSPAHCEDGCGWTGRTPLPLESIPPRGACPACGGTAVGI